MDDAQDIPDASTGGKRKKDQPSLSLGLEVKASGIIHCMGKFFRSRMMKRTAPLNLSREI